MRHRLVMKQQKKTSYIYKPGSALLIVLFIVMAITLLSLGFLSRSDVELQCGQNMCLRFQADYTAESALDYARDRILNPQDANSEYWGGAIEKQLVAGEDEYFDVSVTKLGDYDYRIISEGYRKQASVKTGNSRLEAQLRLDPCIAFWSGGITTITGETVINGDVYCGNNLTIVGVVNGDAFSIGSITGSVMGRKNESCGAAPVSWPGLSIADYSTSYYYNGGGPYSVKELSAGIYDNTNPFPGAGMNNPACVYYRPGDVTFDDATVINGTLVVSGNLRLGRGVIVTIEPVKNFPALIVGGEGDFFDRNASLSVTGLVQVSGNINMNNKSGGIVEINGALCIGGGIVNTSGCSVTVTSIPNSSAIKTWSGPGSSLKWSAVGGAFFKNIQRW